MFLELDYRQRHPTFTLWWITACNIYMYRKTDEIWLPKCLLEPMTNICCILKLQGGLIYFGVETKEVILIP